MQGIDTSCQVLEQFIQDNIEYVLDLYFTDKFQDEDDFMSQV